MGIFLNLRRGSFCDFLAEVERHDTMGNVHHHPHDLIPYMLNLKEIDDLPFNEIPVFELFTSGLPDIEGTADQSRLEMNMAAESDIIENRGALKEFDLLEGP